MLLPVNSANSLSLYTPGGFNNSLQRRVKNNRKEIVPVMVRIRSKHKARNPKHEGNLKHEIGKNQKPDPDVGGDSSR